MNTITKNEDLMADTPVDRDSGMPLYHQVALAIRAEIRAGAYSHGGKIPSERELCEIHAVSRITIIRALKELVGEGLIERRVGQGTFVVERNSEVRTSIEGGAVGLVAPLLRGDSFFNSIVNGVERVCSAREISLSLAFSKRDAGVEWRCMQRLKEQGVFGIILFMSDTASSWRNVERLVDSGLPVVLIDHRAPGVDHAFDTVTSDNLRGGFLAAQHLLELGHRRIGLLTESGRRSSVVDREEGFRLALANAGMSLPSEYVRVSDAEPDSMRLTVEGWCSLPNPPTAVFAVNDSYAISLMKVLKNYGTAIPSDMSVIGFDDSIFAPLADPPLTTVRQAQEALGQRAIELLLERVASTAHSARHCVIPVELVVRKSTSQPKRLVTP